MFVIQNSRSLNMSIAKLFSRSIRWIIRYLAKMSNFGLIKNAFCMEVLINFSHIPLKVVINLCLTIFLWGHTFRIFAMYIDFHFSFSNELPPNDPSRVRTAVADPRADSLTQKISSCSQAHPMVYNNNSTRTSTTVVDNSQHFKKNNNSV